MCRFEIPAEDDEDLGGYYRAENEKRHGKVLGADMARKMINKALARFAGCLNASFASVCSDEMQRLLKTVATCVEELTAFHRGTNVDIVL